MPPVLSVDRTAPAHRRVEIEQKLIEAVRRRDSRSTARLIEQWVHRRDLGSLERFCGGPLSDGLGREAGDWLEHCITAPRQSLQPQPLDDLQSAGGPQQARQPLVLGEAPSAESCLPVPYAIEAPLSAPRAASAAACALGAGGSSARGEVGGASDGSEAIAMAAPCAQGSASTTADALDSQAGRPQHAHQPPTALCPPSSCDPGQAWGAGGAAVAREPVLDTALPASPDSTVFRSARSGESGVSSLHLDSEPEESSLTDSASEQRMFLSALQDSGAAPADSRSLSGLADQPPAAGSHCSALSSADAMVALTPPAGPDALPSVPRRHFGLAALGKVRALMRECVEEAIGTLQSRSVGLDEDDEADGDEDAGSALQTPTSLAGAPGWSPQRSMVQPELDETELPPQASWTRPRAAAISAGLAGASSASSGPPAPAPAALADLRSWLPSAGDNGRRAS